MGKVAFWLVVVFGALFVVRIINAGKARQRARDARSAAPAAPAAMPMVQCRECRVYLPRADAVPVADGFRCGDGGGCCGKRH